MKKSSLKYLIALVLLFTVVISCKKDTQEDIKTEDLGFVKFTFNGKEYNYKGSTVQYSTEDKTEIQYKYESGANFLVLAIHSKVTGDFIWGNYNQLGYASIKFVDQANNKQYTSNYWIGANCGTQSYSDGKVIITKYGGKGEFVEGTFTANLRYGVCEDGYDVKPITGSFKSYIQ